MKIIDSNLQDYEGTEFKVYKNLQGITVIEFLNGDWLENEEYYSDVYLGKCDSCSGFFKDSFKDFTYDSVLVAGLGIGMIPYELSEVNNCSIIDVVEISQEVIDYNISSGHLPSDINIIKSDIFEYSTEEKYDLIIIDTIWKEEEISEAQVDLLVSKFLNTNLNTGGVLYIPVLEKWLINK